jgi:hypothetical protein
MAIISIVCMKMPKLKFDDFVNQQKNLDLDCEGAGEDYLTEYINAGWDVPDYVNYNFGVLQTQGIYWIFVDEWVGGFYPKWKLDLTAPLEKGYGGPVVPLLGSEEPDLWKHCFAVPKTPRYFSPEKGGITFANKFFFPPIPFKTIKECRLSYRDISFSNESIDDILKRIKEVSMEAAR